MQSSLLHPESFHPVFKTSISAPGHENCTLNLHYGLPPMIFIDPYELSNRADTYSFKYAGPSNLELPVFALGGGGEDDKNAQLLVTMAQPLSAEGVLEVEVPLHARYGHTRASTVASSENSFQLTQIPWPDAFLACPASTTKAKSQLLPSMRPDFAAAFDNSFIVPLSPPPGAVPVETIRTPVGDGAHVRSVEVGTAVTVLVAFFYLVRAVRRTMVRLGTPSVALHAKKQ
ncbi:RBR-type E3 ubiquitin transferase [Mycena sanguinolenta]|uniref:Protein PBN1 n=1 Tax=Mycena sanguinolenta TaxID=230812 RepID=A0A8H6XQC4_9AGAR|nr:RBR-type E3 ubiquitin transferase [Mycena sanguinolenta]